MPGLLAFPDADGRRHDRVAPVKSVALWPPMAAREG
jgi:hypothetical protein